MFLEVTQRERKNLSQLRSFPFRRRAVCRCVVPFVPRAPLRAARRVPFAENVASRHRACRRSYDLAYTVSTHALSALMAHGEIAKPVGSGRGKCNSAERPREKRARAAYTRFEPAVLPAATPDPNLRRMNSSRPVQRAARFSRSPEIDFGERGEESASLTACPMS